jgi:hypothetical protein
MSRGPGRLQRGITALMMKHPDGTFSLAQLCRHLYCGEAIEKKHRVAILRAMHNLRTRDWDIWQREAHGPHSELILYNAASLASTQAAMGSTYPGHEGRWRQIAVERVEHHIAQRDGKLARAEEIEAKWAAEE